LATAHQKDDHQTDVAPDAEAGPSAAVEAWLKQHSKERPLDWQGCLFQLRRALEQLCSSKVIRQDDRAQQIIQRMVSAPDIETLAVDIDLLGDRVAELTGYALGPRWRAPVLSIAGFEQRAGAKQDKTNDQDSGRSPRMVLRL
jgi:hypothetical protein